MKKRYFYQPKVSPANMIEEKIVQESYTANGRILTRLVKKTIDVSTRDEGKKVEDFCLENQIAVNSLGLQNTFALGADRLDSVDASINEAITELDKQQSKQAE